MAATRDVAGRRYAEAIMDIARASAGPERATALESWLEFADALESLTAESRFVDALQGDGMTDERLQAVVRRVMPNATPAQVNVVRLLRRKARLPLGPSIASYLRELVDEERGIVRAVVTTAVALDEQRLAQLRDRITAGSGRQVQLETRVDPDIMGGLVVRIGDQLIDGSVRNRLHSLRSSLERAAV